MPRRNRVSSAGFAPGEAEGKRWARLIDGEIAKERFDILLEKFTPGKIGRLRVVTDDDGVEDTDYRAGGILA